jgi:hypothetical protein
MGDDVVAALGQTVHVFAKESSSNLASCASILERKLVCMV